MIDYIVSILREYPTLALFLTIGLGFLIGKIRIGTFSIGSVPSVLLVGLLVGQLDIPMSGPVKTVFFMMFLFSIGYSVGPDFFKSLRGQGARQALFALLMSCMCAGVTLALSWIFKYTKGETVGLFSGSQTCSALLGVGAEALGKLGLSKEDLQSQLNMIPICYAVTYIFGTLGTVIIVGNLGPRLLGGLKKVKEQTAELEKKLNTGDRHKDPAYISVKRAVAYRAYNVENVFFETPKTVKETELHLHSIGIDVYVDRIKHDDKISAPRYDDLIHAGDEIVVCGRIDYMVRVETEVGTEVSDTDLLAYSIERVGVVVVKKDFIGKELYLLRKNKFMQGVVIRDLERDGKTEVIDGSTVFKKGDRITIMGQPVQVKLAAANIGHMDRPSISSDLMFVGLAIFIGGLFGAMSFFIGSIPISFGTSGGALVAGLVFGWWRSKRPTFGNIPAGALWFMNNLGLNVFIAVIGIEAAPSFVAGIEKVGPMLFVAGAIGTSIPLFFGLWLGHKVFKFNPAITLGCCAGTRTCTASLGAVQDTLGSTLPAIGYTVTYAVANLMLVIWGLVTVLVA